MIYQYIIYLQHEDFNKWKKFKKRIHDDWKLYFETTQKLEF